MAKSIRQSIVESIIARLQTITVANGYETNLGSNVFDWKLSAVQEGSLPCVALRDTNETIERRGGNHLHTLSNELEAKADGSDSQVYNTDPVENEQLDFEAENKEFSTINMTFSVKYSTLAFQPYQ